MILMTKLQKNFGDKKKRYKYYIYRKQKNLGIYDSWKMGLQQANGEVACLIDADLNNRSNQNTFKLI